MGIILNYIGTHCKQKNHISGYGRTSDCDKLMLTLILRCKKKSLCYGVCVSNRNEMMPEKRRASVDRNTTTIAVPGGVMEDFDAFLGRFGGRGLKKDALGRLISWFVKQPDSVKQIILGWFPGDVAQSQSALLRDLANKVERDAGPEGPTEINVYKKPPRNPGKN
jgi:hypothetical protein